MAVYRQIYMTFWTDRKIDEDFTPEDRYIYLYLLTNSHTSISGCYEIGYKQISRECGYDEEKVKRIVSILKEKHKVIDYDDDNREVLLVNWHKYNWCNSPKLYVGVQKNLKTIKSERFKEYLSSLIARGTDTVSIGYQNPMDTSVSASDTDTDISSDAGTDNASGKKNKYGEYKHVLLTDEEYQKLKNEFPDTDDAITFLDEYIEMKGTQYKSHYLALRKWVFDAIEEEKQKKKGNKDEFLEFLKEEAERCRREGL